MEKLCQCVCATVRFRQTVSSGLYENGVFEGASGQTGGGECADIGVGCGYIGVRG